MSFNSKTGEKLKEQPQYTSSGEVILYRGLLENSLTVNDYLNLEPVLSEAIARGLFCRVHTSLSEPITVTSNVLKQATEKTRLRVIEKIGFNNRGAIFYPYLRSYMKIFDDFDNILENINQYENDPIIDNIWKTAIHNNLEKNMFVENTLNIKNGDKTNCSSLSIMNFTPDAIQYSIAHTLNPMFFISHILEFKNAHDEDHNKRTWDVIATFLRTNLTRTVLNTNFAGNDLDLLYEKIYDFNSSKLQDTNIFSKYKVVYPLRTNNLSFKEGYSEQDFNNIILQYLDTVFGSILYYYNSDIIEYNGNVLKNHITLKCYFFENAVRILIPIIYIVYLYYGTIEPAKLPKEFSRYINKTKIRYDSESLNILRTMIKAFEDSPPK